MSLTPNLQLPYPELSDTADVPRDIKALADKLDALLGGGGGGNGGGGSGALPLNNAPVKMVGQLNQIRAGRQLTVGDFTGLGLTTPPGLWNLSDLTNLGSGGALTNLGAVPFGVGINGLATTCAVFAGSTGQALYISDIGAADPFRIRTGTFGCWMRTAKRGIAQCVLSKFGTAGNAFWLGVGTGNVVQLSIQEAAATTLFGLTDIADDRWHQIVGSADGSTRRIYVDGALEALDAFGVINPGAAPLNIGAERADGATAAINPFYGRVDEAFVTPEVLTEDQVRLLYAARLTHQLGSFPTTARLSVHRARRGAALAVADFPSQPTRLHNFTGGALADEGSGGVVLVANPATGTIVDVAGADGSVQGGKSMTGTHQGLSSTDTGLPGGLTTRSYGFWLKSTAIGAAAPFSYGTAGHAQVNISSTGNVQCFSGADNIIGPIVNDGQWHQIIAVEDNTAGDGVRRKLYVDGRLVGGSTVMNAIVLLGANRFRIGAASDGTAPYAGQYDGVFVAGYALTAPDVAALWGKGSQSLGASPKNAGDHVERLDAASVLFIGDTLEPQWTVDLGVIA